MKRLLILTAAVWMAMTLMCSCGGGKDSNQPPLASNSVIVADDSIPEGISPNITGVITSISEVRDGISVLVEIPDAKNAYSDNRYYVTVTGKTVLENKDKVRCESYREISPGDTVSVWFKGGTTGTSPDYAVAQGVRITSKVDDLLMTVRHGESVVMASPTVGEVTSTDIKPLLYGSYLITDGNGILSLDFAKPPVSVTASAISVETGESVYLPSSGSVTELEIPGTLNEGDYTVTVKAESDEGADYYIFILSVR
ncbi:MAG: hypothetical protein IJM51_04050 [Clostridia bacterium]|nr:hypothetical protein [Clostridia bacterium]